MSAQLSNKSSFVLATIAIGLLFFGLTLLLLSLAYARDLTLILNSPFEVWSALCGRPSDNPLTLPVLVCTSVLAVMLGVVMICLNVVRSHRSQ